MAVHEDTIEELEFAGNASGLMNQKNAFARITVQDLNRGAVDTAREWAQLSGLADAANDRVLARREGVRNAKLGCVPVADMRDPGVFDLDATPVSGDDIALLRAAA